MSIKILKIGRSPSKNFLWLRIGFRCFISLAFLAMAFAVFHVRFPISESREVRICFIDGDGSTQDTAAVDTLAAEVSVKVRSDGRLAVLKLRSQDAIESNATPVERASRVAGLIRNFVDEGKFNAAVLVNCDRCLSGLTDAESISTAAHFQQLGALLVSLNEPWINRPSARVEQVTPLEIGGTEIVLDLANIDRLKNSRVTVEIAIQPVPGYDLPTSASAAFDGASATLIRSGLGYSVVIPLNTVDHLRRAKLDLFTAALGDPLIGKVTVRLICDGNLIDEQSHSNVLGDANALWVPMYDWPKWHTRPDYLKDFAGMFLSCSISPASSASLLALRMPRGFDPLLCDIYTGDEDPQRAIERNPKVIFLDFSIIPGLRSEPRLRKGVAALLRAVPGWAGHGKQLIIVGSPNCLALSTVQEKELLPSLYSSLNISRDSLTPLKTTPRKIGFRYDESESAANVLTFPDAGLGTIPWAPLDNSGSSDIGRTTPVTAAQADFDVWFDGIGRIDSTLSSELSTVWRRSTFDSSTDFFQSITASQVQWLRHPDVKLYAQGIPDSTSDQIHEHPETDAKATRGMSSTQFDSIVKDFESRFKEDSAFLGVALANADNLGGQRAALVNTNSIVWQVSKQAWIPFTAAGENKLASHLLLGGRERGQKILSSWLVGRLTTQKLEIDPAQLSHWLDLSGVHAALSPLDRFLALGTSDSRYFSAGLQANAGPLEPRGWLVTLAADHGDGAPGSRRPLLTGILGKSGLRVTLLSSDLAIDHEIVRRSPYEFARTFSDWQLIRDDVDGNLKAAWRVSRSPDLPQQGYRIEGWSITLDPKTGTPQLGSVIREVPQLRAKRLVNSFGEHIESGLQDLLEEKEGTLSVNTSIAVNAIVQSRAVHRSDVGWVLVVEPVKSQNSLAPSLLLPLQPLDGRLGWSYLGDGLGLSSLLRLWVEISMSRELPVKTTAPVDIWFSYRDPSSAEAYSTEMGYPLLPGNREMVADRIVAMINRVKVRESTRWWWLLVSGFISIAILCRGVYQRRLVCQE